MTNAWNILNRCSIFERCIYINRINDRPTPLAMANYLKVSNSYVIFLSDSNLPLNVFYSTLKYSPFEVIKTILEILKNYEILFDGREETFINRLLSKHRSLINSLLRRTSDLEKAKSTILKNAELFREIFPPIFARARPVLARLIADEKNGGRREKKRSKDNGASFERF